MFKLEYAQNYNGEFRAWIDAGVFPTRLEAEKVAKNNGLVEFLISECVYDEELDEWV